MITIASISGGWCIDPNQVEHRPEGNILLAFTACSTMPMKHRLPDSVTFERVLHDIENCRSNIYILPERDGDAR